MKSINLISLTDAYENLNSDLFKSLLEYHSISIKEEEIKDLKILIEHLKTLSLKSSLFDKYFIGYSIPQIAKEFDLLRIGRETVVNVELKRKSTDEKIKTQLLRNRYYLSFLKKETHVFTYVSEEKKIYSIDDNQNLIEIGIRQLLTSLASQDVDNIIDVDSLFNPSSYLVSPFNSTQDFVKGRYFLTSHQEEIKAIILNQLKLPDYSIISIKGKAGTGKTLLTYDIVNEVYKKSEVLVIHCGILNAGHYILKDDYGWNVIAIKYLSTQYFSKYHLIVVDEAQRINSPQLAFIISEVKKSSINCIFSYDGQQTLRKGEIHANIDAEIEKETTFKPFELTTKIRTNKEVASFIKLLFSKEKNIDKITYNNVEIAFFEGVEDAKRFLSQLRQENWKVINYTPSTAATLPYEQYKIIEESDNAHTVIGQEFDNVVAIIDEHFYYKRGILSTKNYQKRPYYHPTKMLFQIVSRTRIKLQIVIIKNSEVLERCLEILRG